ncbi:MAG TPA: DUF2071 domain-containing protein [Gemmataceae bacterium]|jgi:hypothetical protein
MRRPFLTAEWRNLFLATYAVPPSLLRARLPVGLELDTRDGEAFVSLVAFQFIHTRVLGVPWPGYRNFPELNLRYYVRHGDDRGVVFVREIVSPRLVAWMARITYNESYRIAPLTSHCQEDEEERSLEYRLMWADREQLLRVSGRKSSYLPGPASDEHFFKELRWGFGRTRRGQTLRYEVAHPPWQVFPVQAYHIEIDWASVYGPQWKFLNKATPLSTIFADGSAIALYSKGPLP